MPIFGTGSVILVVVSAKYIAAYLRRLIVTMLVVGGHSMAVLVALRGTVGVSHFTFFLWGLVFGPLVTAALIAFLSKRTLRSSPVASSNHEGES